MSISHRALGIRDLPEREQPLSEQFRLAAERWVAAKKKRDIVRGLKNTMFTRKVRELLSDARRDAIKMTKTDAEGFIESSQEWEQYIIAIADAEEATELAWARCEEIRMRFSEWQSAEANDRAERKMSR